MKISTTLTMLFLSLASVSWGAPIFERLGEESLATAARSFESDWSQLEDKVQDAAAKKAAWSKKEKVIAGVGAALSLLGMGGYVASPAISMSIAHHHDEEMRKLREAVARADAAKAAEEARQAEGFRNAAAARERDALKVFRRGVTDAVEHATAGMEHLRDDESFYSALSRSNSERLADTEIEPYASKESLIHRNTHEASGPPPMYVFDPKGELAKSGHFEDLYRGSPSSEGGETHERMAALEAAVLSLKQHQKETQKVSNYAKWLLGAGSVSAVAGIVSADLSIENAIEAGKRANQKLPDVHNLDAATCAEYAKHLSSLDCSAARGTPPSAAH